MGKSVCFLVTQLHQPLPSLRAQNYPFPTLHFSATPSLLVSQVPLRLLAGKLLPPGIELACGVITDDEQALAFLQKNQPRWPVIAEVV